MRSAAHFREGEDDGFDGRVDGIDDTGDVAGQAVEESGDRGDGGGFISASALGKYR